MSGLRTPSHICLDCGALGYAGGYHDHGDGNAGDTVAIERLLSEYKRLAREVDEMTEDAGEVLDDIDAYAAKDMDHDLHALVEHARKALGIEDA